MRWYTVFLMLCFPLILFARYPLVEREGFPVNLGYDPSFAGPLFSGPVVIDLDGDGIKEVVANNEKKVFVFRSDGTLLPGWPVTMYYSSQQNASVGDIDGDGYYEIVMRDREGIDGPSSYLYAWELDGTPLPGFPQNFPIETEMPLSPLLFDFDGDGDCEILFYSTHELYIVDDSCESLPGFPVYNEGCFVYTLIGDFDGNGIFEIATLNNRETINFYNGDGSTFSEPLSSPIENLGISSLSIGDYDHNGKHELFVTLYGGEASNYRSVACLMDYTGEVYPGWPRELGREQYLLQPCSWADVNRDSFLEMVFTTHRGSLFVFQGNGELLPGFPARQALGRPSSLTPIVADLDGDFFPEIFVDNEFFIDDSSSYHVFQHTGMETDWSPIRTSFSSALNYPTITDVENDDTLDMFMYLEDPYETETYLYGFKFIITSSDSFYLPWPMAGQNPQHTFLNLVSRDSASSNITPVQVMPETPYLFQNYPNPFNSFTRFRVLLPYNSQVTLEVYDLKGIKVGTLWNGYLVSGEYAFEWQPENISSGVYLYKLTFEGGVLVRKCIYLK